MRRLLLAGLLAATLVACEDPADSAECREWQDQVISARAAMLMAELPAEVADAAWADDRPEGCPWP